MVKMKFLLYTQGPQGTPNIVPYGGMQPKNYASHS